MHALILLLTGESDHLKYLMLLSCLGFAVPANRMLCYQSKVVAVVLAAELTFPPARVRIEPENHERLSETKFMC